MTISSLIRINNVFDFPIHEPPTRRILYPTTLILVLYKRPFGEGLTFDLNSQRFKLSKETPFFKESINSAIMGPKC